MSQEQSTIDMEDLFTVLSEARRRATVEYLAEHPDWVNLRTLADNLAAEERDADETKTQQAVYISLYQSHLPMLKKHGIVDAESRSAGQGDHFVKPGPQFDRAQATLKAATADPDSWTNWFRNAFKTVFRRP